MVEDFTTGSVEDLYTKKLDLLNDAKGITECFVCYDDLYVFVWR